MLNWCLPSVTVADVTRSLAVMGGKFDLCWFLLTFRVALELAQAFI